MFFGINKKQILNSKPHIHTQIHTHADEERKKIKQDIILSRTPGVKTYGEEEE